MTSAEAHVWYASWSCAYEVDRTVRSSMQRIRAARRIGSEGCALTRARRATTSKRSICFPSHHAKKRSSRWKQDEISIDHAATRLHTQTYITKHSSSGSVSQSDFICEYDQCRQSHPSSRHRSRASEHQRLSRAVERALLLRT